MSVTARGRTGETAVDLPSSDRGPRVVLLVVGILLLATNLRASLTGEGALRPYRAQAGFLSLLNAGDGTAVAAWKGLAFHGRAMWRLKDAIDRRFMARFQGLAAQRSGSR